MNQSIYMDYNATTPVDAAVLEAMLPCFTTHFGNAASTLHQYGWIAEEAVENSRKQVAKMLGAGQNEITFTSGATESINTIIKGIAVNYAHKGKHIISTKTEHKAVLDTLQWLEKKGCSVTYLNVNRLGNIDLDELEKSIKKDTILISIMYANNETGVINPVKEIAEIAHKNNIIFFADATQAAGKLTINVNEMGIDALCISAHKMYGPKGVGAIYLRRKNPRVSIEPLLHGGGHENGLRSGTLNVPGIVGLGKASELAEINLWENAKHISKLRTILEQNLTLLPNVFINGDIKNRLNNTTNICFKNNKVTDIIKHLKYIAVATGSACTSALATPSHVLTAMGLSEEESYSSIRFSLGKYTTEEEVMEVIKSIAAYYKEAVIVV